MDEDTPDHTSSDRHEGFSNVTRLLDGFVYSITEVLKL